MKKALAAAMALIWILSLFGCSGKRIPGTVHSLAEVTGKNIGVMTGSAAYHFSEDLGTLRTYEAEETMLVDLKNGVTDCAVMDEQAARVTMKKVRGLKLLDERLMDAEFRFAIARENRDLTEAVNKALEGLREEGVLDKIAGGYFGATDYRYAPSGEAAPSAGVLTLAVGGRFEPYIRVDGDGRVTGLDIDVAQAVCDVLGVELEILAVNEGAVITAVQYGKANFALGGITDNEEDGALVDFTDPYTRCVQVVVVRR